MELTTSSSDVILVMEKKEWKCLGTANIEMSALNMTLRELKFCPVKFGQYFRMFVGQFGGLLCQLASRLQGQRTNDREPNDPDSG